MGGWGVWVLGGMCAGGGDGGVGGWGGLGFKKVYPQNPPFGFFLE